MPRIVQLRPETDSEEYLPPTFYLKFTEDEVPAFLQNPAGTLRALGQSVNNLTVVVKDHVWDARNEKWLTDRSDDAVFAADGGLPPATHAVLWCGYSDEMCVCEWVLVP